MGTGSANLGLPVELMSSVVMSWLVTSGSQSCLPTPEREKNENKNMSVNFLYSLCKLYMQKYNIQIQCQRTFCYQLKAWPEIKFWEPNNNYRKL